MLDRAEQELRELKAGTRKAQPIPTPAMRNLTIRDGAFYSGDTEVLLIGPLGWWEPFDDLKSLAELGFNLFSSTLIAQSVTPSPEKVRLSDARRIDHGIREAARYNLAFDFLISPHPLPPGWLKEHPEMSQYPSGGWIGSSLYHAATRTMIETMWKHLLPEVRNNPNLIALDLVNEWSFADGVREIHPAMLAKFQTEMRNRYGTIEEANRHWGTDCKDFTAIDPLKLKESSPGFRYDFESFRNREGLENLRFLRDTARKYAPNVPLHVKTIAITDLEPGRYLPVGVQREERGEITDFAGSDCAGIMELDYFRSMVPGKPAADTEFHVSINTTPHEIAADAWSAMLHGESLREYYAWTGRYSAELMAAGALLHIPESLEALGRTALDLRRLASEVIAFQREIVVRSLGRRIERRDKDRLRRVHGVRNDAVGPLDDHRPQTRTEQKFDNLLTRGLFETRHRERLVLLPGVRGHSHRKHLALLTPIDGRHRAADGRREEYTLVELVEEQRRTGLHPITHLNQQFRCHTLEIQGREGILRSHRRFRQRLLGFAHQIDV